jgi:diguanylate cyclase (GGDEF)-like protein
LKQLDSDFGSFTPFVASTFLSMGALFVLLKDDAALVPVMLVVCALAGVAVLIFGRGKRLASELRSREAQAKHMALHDAMTGLPNRLLFTDRLGHAIEQLRRKPGSVAVLALDLDRFKEVNDTFGHQFGDELLRQVSRRLGDICRASDTVARLGGDEFAIVAEGASAQVASTLADRIIAAMSQAFDLSCGRVFIGSSVGIAMLQNGKVDTVDAMRQADLALYRAKEAGGGQYAFFKREMDAAQRTRKAIENDLRDALANGGLTMAYQPQVNAEGETIALEALLRWDHPTRGAVAPAFFVGIAEECGLIEPLSIFTLRTAFKESQRWPAPVRVAVNLSASFVRMRGFLEVLERLVAETEVDPNRMELEITESLFMGDDPQVQATLKRVRELGFSLALDDFGTGYSSLSYLQRYPVDKIKIDQSFVRGLGKDKESGAVVDAIVKLAGALNLAVVAEGVETEEQRSRLEAAGCPDVQGFLFSRAVTPAEVDDMLETEARAAAAG